VQPEHGDLESTLLHLSKENKNLRIENKLLREQLNWTDDHDWIDKKSWYKSRITILQQENEVLLAENNVLKTKISSLEKEVMDLKSGVCISPLLITLSLYQMLFLFIILY